MRKLLVLFLLLLSQISFAENNFVGKVGEYRTLYLKNDNIFYGEILSINEDGTIEIDTKEGVLTIPSDQILEETLKIKKNNGTSFSGKIIGESEVYIKLQTEFGEVTVNKGEIQDLKRFYGGKREKVIQQKVFFAGEEQITDLFGDPTAFVLPPYAFYISGFSMGYGFSDRLHLYTKITNNFNEDLNLSCRYVFMKKNYGAKKANFSAQLKIFSNHDMLKEYGKYYDDLEPKNSDIELSDKKVLQMMYGKKDRQFYWESSLVYSMRFPLKSGRGNWGFHVGTTINQLLFKKPVANLNTAGTTTFFTGGFDNSQFDAYRTYIGFDYDLSKRIKFIALAFYDPGNRYMTFGESISNYFKNDFVQAGNEGDRKELDFDFGITFTPNQTLRIGFHFQNPFITVYWKFLDY